MSKNPLISTFIFAALSFIPAAAGIFLLPLYLNKLSISEYAILNLAGVFAGLVVMVSNLKLDAAMRTFYFDYEEEGPELKMYVRQLFSASLFILGGFYLIFLMTGPLLFRFIFKSEELLFYPHGCYALSAAMLAMAKAPYMIYLKNQVRLKEFAAYQLGEFSLIVILQAVFILILGWGLEGAFLGLLYAQLIVFGVFMVLQYRLLTGRLKKAYLLPSLKFAILLLPFVCMNGFILKGDRILFERFSSLDEVGKYALLMTILGLSRLIFNALDNAIRPFLFVLFKQGVANHKASISSLLSFYVSISCIFLSSILFAGNYLSLFTQNESYLEIIPYLGWGVLVLIPSILSRIFNLQLVFVKKSNLISGYSFISFSCLILGFYFWVPIYGIMGALGAVGISNLINWVLFGWLAHTHFSTKGAIYSSIKIVLVTTLIFVASIFLSITYPNSSINFDKIQFPILLLLIIVLSYKDIQHTSSLRKQSATSKSLL